jgi:hypothetical protein
MNINIYDPWGRNHRGRGKRERVRRARRIVLETITRITVTAGRRNDIRQTVKLLTI